MQAISSYHGNRPTNTQTHTHTQTHRQDRLQYTAQLSLACSVMTEKLYIDSERHTNQIDVTTACASCQYATKTHQMFTENTGIHPVWSIGKYCLQCSHLHSSNAQKLLMFSVKKNAIHATQMADVLNASEIIIIIKFLF